MSELYQHLQNQLGAEFKNQELLLRALTHSSYRNEVSEVTDDNERLEFLGDAVLDLALSQLLMSHYPSDQEGALSKKRASLVNTEALCTVAQELGLNSMIFLGKGEKLTGGGTKASILASVTEALFGALFLDSGFDVVFSAIERVFAGRIADLQNSGVDYFSDYKTRLQEQAMLLHRQIPTYKLASQSGPDHEKIFVVSVRMGDMELALGSGKSKKSAEQEGARLGLEALKKISQEKNS